MAMNLPEAEQHRRARFVLRDLLFFWTIVDSADDVDRVTRLGYRICMWVLIYNVISIVPDLVNLEWIAYATLVLLVLLYFAGANALRQKSAIAAAALCALQGDGYTLFLPAQPFLSLCKLPHLSGVADRMARNRA